MWWAILVITGSFANLLKGQKLPHPLGPPGKRVVHIPTQERVEVRQLLAVVAVPLQHLLRHVLLPILHEELIGHERLLLAVRLKQLLEHQLRLVVHLLPRHEVFQPLDQILLPSVRLVVLGRPLVQI